MDRRAAGALLALAACFACSAAAPTASNQTALDLYDGTAEGCYYNFQHYGEGDRIMTNEPCLNCTCHNRMLMCYLRVCPFTKAIGQDCTVEKRADQCCPIVTCPDVPVDLLTSTSTTSPAEYGATGLGKPDKYGCSINGKYFSEGSKVPPTPNKPCEHCYCIRNMTTCVMQECTLHVDGCTPIYHKDVCCPVRYSCDHPEDELPLLDDMSTTVRPTPGFLLTTTTLAPVTQMTQDCVHDDRVFSDGALIKTEKACEHCYCMKGDIVCVVQECGAPMENEGKNCTSLPPREGQCCPDTYICEGDELTSDLPSELTTESFIEKLTTLSPPRRTNVEGSGYRNEPDEAPYTDMPIIEPDVEGSGEEETPKPLGPDEIIPTPGEDEPYIYVTTKGPDYDKHEKPTIPDMKDKTIEPHVSATTPTSADEEKLTTSTREDILEPHKHAPTTKAPETYESATTELGDSQNTVPDVIPDEEIAKPHEYTPGTTIAPSSESESLSPIEGEDDKLSSAQTSKPEHSTTITSTLDETEKETATPSDVPNVTPGVITKTEYTDGDITRTTSATSVEESPVKEDKETSKQEELIPGTTSSPAEEEKESSKPEELAPSATSSPPEEEKESSKPEELATSTTSSPAEEEKESSKPEELAPSTTISPPEEEKESSKPEELAPSTTSSPAEEEKESSKPEELAPSTTSSPAEEEKESSKPEELAPSTTSSPVDEEKESSKPEELTSGTTSSPAEEEKESSKPEELAPSATSSPHEEGEKLTTEPDHAQNTVAVSEEESTHPHSYVTTAPPSEKESTTASKQEQDFESDKVTKEDVLEPTDHVTTAAFAEKEIEFTTAEPDRGLNTIPSEVYEETSSEPSLPGRTTLSAETKGTEPSIITDEMHTQGVEIKSTIVSELTTPLPDSIATKGDQFTITTEPSFRKEDEGVVSTEKPKEIEPTTVKSEFVDEGLIPTSPHEDKISTSSDVPTTEEEFATSVPEYITEIAETVGDKQTTTEASKETSVVTEITPGKVSEPSLEPDGDLPSSTEKLTEITPVVETHEEPSRIPGEGDCLLNGITYKNNTVVPSTNNCHTGCRCASSIIRCDPIVCSPPPDYMDNCQSIYDSPDSCCPTFVCDHPRETAPPQSDNQMSGTESPMPTPTSECRGDQCETIEPTKQPLGPSEPCTSGNCLTTDDHKTETECGSDGCGDLPQKPDIPMTSDEHTAECSNGKCKPESCANGICQSPPTQVSPVTPCEGEHCEKTDEVIPDSQQQCKNGEDCKILEIPTPCEGESCNKIDCGAGGCGSDIIATQPDHQPESCKEEDGCKPQNIPTLECTGSEPCRRKETSTSDAKPPACEGPNCVSEKETTVAQGSLDLSTELPKSEPTPSEEVTEKILPSEEDKTMEPDDHVPKPIDEKIPVKDIQETDAYTTEGQTTEAVTSTDIKEKPVTEDEATDKSTTYVEKETEMPVTKDKEDIDKPISEQETKKPAVIEKESTEIPDIIKEETTKPSVSGEEDKEITTLDEEKSTIKPTLVENIGTEEPTLIGDEGKEKPDIIEKESTELPTIDSESTEKPAIIDKEKPIIGEDATKGPTTVDDDDKQKPVIDEESTKKPDIADKDDKEKPVVDEESTKQPDIVDEDDKEKPVVDEDGKEKPVVDGEITEQPDIIDEEDKEKPVVDEEITKKPDTVHEDDKEKPVTDEESTKKPHTVDEEDEGMTVVDEKTTKKPDIVDEDDKEKPIVDEESTKKPDIVDEDDKEKPVVDEESTKKPDTVDEDDKEKPVVDEESTKKPDTVDEDDKEKPVVDEESTKKPDIVDEDDKEKPVVDEESTKKPDIVDEESTKQPDVVDEESTKKPDIVDEESTKKPDIVDEEGTKKPDIVDVEITKKPDIFDVEGTTKSDITEKEVTVIPGTEEEVSSVAPDIIDHITTDEPVTTGIDTGKPSIIDEDGKDKPVDTEKDKTDKPAITEEVTEKPIIVDEEGKPGDIDLKDTEKPGQEPIKETGSEKPDHTETYDTDKPEVDEGITENPVIKEETTAGAIVTDEDEKLSHGKDKITEKPTDLEEKETEAPALDTEDSEKKPTVFEQDGTEKSTVLDKESTEKPLVELDDKAGPVLTEPESTEKSVTSDASKPEKLPEIEDEHKDKPDVSEGSTVGPSIVDETPDIDYGTEEPAIIDKDTEKPALVDEDDKEKPSEVEIETKKPIDIEKEGTELPINIGEEITKKPVIIDEEGIKTPGVEEDTMKPFIIEEESTAVPDITKEEGTAKPVIIDEGTEEPTIIEKEHPMKPVVIEREGTELPAIDGDERTEKPAVTDKGKPELADQEGTKKPAIVEEGTKEPGVPEEGTEEPTLIDEDDKMKPVDREDSKKPILVEDKDQEKPLVIDEEVTYKPTIDEVVSTEEPKIEEGLGTKKPEATDTTELDKDMKSPEITIQPTESMITEIEKTTKTPYSESETTVAGDVVTSPQGTPEIMVTESEDSYSKEPVIGDHSGTPEISTESLSELEITTKKSALEHEKVTTSEQDVEGTTLKVDTTDIKEEGSTVGQDLISEEPDLFTQVPESHKTTGAVEKTTEKGLTSEQEEVSTDTSEIESPTTKAPDAGSVSIEPQDGIEPDKPELHVTSKTEEDSTTKVYEDKIKPTPESHETEVSSASPEYSPEVDEKTTRVPLVEIKTDYPETYSSEKEVSITETPEFSVTEPVRRFTEIEDPSVTGQEDIATGYPEQTTEHRVPSGTEKIDESGDVGVTGSEKPMLTDIDSELPEKDIESDKPVTKLPEQDYQTPEAEKEKPAEEFESPATEIPMSVVTESQSSSVPEKDVTSYGDKITTISDLSDDKQEGIEVTQHQVSTTEGVHKATEPFVTEPQETSTKAEEQEVKDSQTIPTDIHKTSEKEGETVTRAPEQMHTESYGIDKKEPTITEIQKVSTDLPIEETHTDMPVVQISSEVPQSLVTEQKESVGEQTTASSIPKDESSFKPELSTTESEEISKAPEKHDQDKIPTESPVYVTEPLEISTKETEKEDKITHVSEDTTDQQDTATTLREPPAVTEKTEPIEIMKPTEHASAQTEVSETTPYLIELEEHTHKIEEDFTTASPIEEEHSQKPAEDISTSSPSEEEEHSQKPMEDIAPSSPSEEEHSYKPTDEISTSSPTEEEDLHKPVEDTSTSSPSEEEYSHKPVEEYTPKIEEHVSTVSSFEEKATTVQPGTGEEHQISEVTTKQTDEEIETATKEAEGTTKSSEESLPEDVSEKVSESIPVAETTSSIIHGEDDKDAADHKEFTTAAPTQITEESTPTIVTEPEKLPTSESDIAGPTEKEISTSEKPEEEFIFPTTKATTIRQEEDIATSVSDDKLAKPEEKPSETSEVPPSRTTTEVSKPIIPDLHPTDEIPVPDDDGHFPTSGTSGYGEPDYVEEDQAFGPGTCRYGGKVYVSAQQIPRDDPCDFCFCFRSDIICLQQSCPPPIHGCHEEPIQGFCCPRYECPVSMATTVNVTTTTTTTTTTLPPHFPTHSYKGQAQRRGCQIKGHTYKVGEVVRSSSGPCLHCTCGGDGQMKCDPKACTPEPMLRQMIAAAVSAKRRR